MPYFATKYLLQFFYIERENNVKHKKKNIFEQRRDCWVSCNFSRTNKANSNRLFKLCCFYYIPREPCFEAFSFSIHFDWKISKTPKMCDSRLRHGHIKGIGLKIFNETLLLVYSEVSTRCRYTIQRPPSTTKNEAIVICTKTALRQFCQHIFRFVMKIRYTIDIYYIFNDMATW